ncbi:hypothetical protein WOLCODRAFT_126993 [Wolfiporia cocos MD-104 SS10]|uniref:Nitrogen regulatory protein areA GATA-like domain-containing protein n=1 Tax=Wolfiporia cocos (strain MD-104) TaxID=742152 RepID=A0A2H3J231_WOLCO|nr:hypothetical protein WOLCODRAFT_126993 [Wolfiporia cocos MD-104 SS10]
MPVPPTLTSYLPVLLVSVSHNAVPDDTSFSTLPDGQVDYLSHEWREEDVWRSWRNMTRQKNAIANGMRLENASWRTWWKQRNKLKTVSPETLNWLKDSDVTWLYGPLHIGSDWSPPSRSTESLHAPKRQNSADAVPLARANTDTHASGATSQPKKPILKRRSISQLLLLPSSPWFEQADTDEEDNATLEAEGDEDGSKRPSLLHTKSDTHISWRGRPHRKDSPPRIIAEGAPEEPSGSRTRDPSVAMSTLTSATSSGASNATGSDPELSGSSSVGSGATHESGGLKKKHISFNTFVEQCIAIEKPATKRHPTGAHRGAPVFNYDDGYDEDSEVGYDEDEDSPSYYIDRPAVNSDSDDDDEDVLEMRTSRSRASSTSSTSHRMRPSFSADMAASSYPRCRPPLMRKASTGGERVTIAPIAPTILKSTGVGNNLISVGTGKITPVPKDVELVYVPPSNSNYGLHGSPNVGSEDVYHHRESYFSIGTSPSPSRSPLSSPQVPTAAVLPPPGQLSSSPPKYETVTGHFFPHQSPVGSPIHHDDLSDGVVEDTFDYFDGPTLTRDYSGEWSSARGRSNSRDDMSDGGAASVPTGRSSRGHSPPTYSPGQSPQTPVVLVNEVNGATEERTERSRESSPSYADHTEDSTPTFVHTTTPAVPVPRVGASRSNTHPQISFSQSPQVPECVLLSPPDFPGRGRTPPGSASGSTTTGPSSCSRSSDSRSDSRGRSLTRNASFSDRERSGSRSSRGTNSPMGSLSPTGSALALGGANAYAKGRERDSRSLRGDEERGRERTGRALAASLSPPNLVESPTRDAGEYQAYSPSVVSSTSEESSPPSSVSGSSTASAATVRQSSQMDALSHSSATSRPRAPGIAAVPIPSPIQEEDEQRSRHPTPANSPVSALNPVLPPSASPASPQEKSARRTTSPDAKSPINSASPVPIPRPKTYGPRDGQQDPQTLVSRAVDIVSSARGFLGSIWNSGAA